MIYAGRLRSDAGRRRQPPQPHDAREGPGAEGYSVAAAENRREALERLGAEPFDVVLLDILMPEMEGA